MTTNGKTEFVCIQDYETNAAKVLPPFVWDFYQGGADQEQTLQDNRAAFKRYEVKIL